MPAELLFSAVNLFALLGWAVLALAPYRRGVFIAAARWVAAILCGAYLCLFLLSLTVSGQPASEGEFYTLAGLTALFGRPEVLLVGWVHYLAFDLWIGAWIAEDAPERRIPHWIVLPCLALTLVAGPVGLLVYLFVRAFRRIDPVPALA